MSKNKDVEDIQYILSTLSEKVNKNTTIETPETLNQDFLLHISKDKNIKKFIPVIGQRQADSEDRTVPRLTCSVNILGCLIGYAASESEFLNGHNKNFRGGYYIYKVPFKACLRPNNKLVYDASMSGEHWLISYNPETSEYKGEIIGKIFYTFIQFTGRDDKNPVEEMELCIEVDEEIRFSEKIVLTKGYWLISGPSPNQTKNFKVYKDFEVKEITKSEYMNYKSRTANLLSVAPIFSKW